jgi:PAS domain S-box-containing protein
MSMIDRLLAIPRARRLVAAAALIFGVVWLDWIVGRQISLGSLYIVPIVLLAGTLSRTQTVVLAIVCTSLRVVLNDPSDLFTIFTNSTNSFVAYALIGLFTMELVRSRQKLQDHLTESRQREALLHNTQKQLRLLAESSPAAIFTLDRNARILSGNWATKELLGFSSTSSIDGYCVAENLPALADALKVDEGEDTFRTSIQVQGRQCDGTPFLAQAWFSTYRTDGGDMRLAAIAIDATEETREREELNQEQVIQSGKIIAGAFAHEVRNVSGAMSVAYSNLGRLAGISANEDYLALGQLVAGIRKLSHMELQGTQRPGANSSNLRDVLSQLRILIDSAWQEKDAEIHWPDVSSSVAVAADSFAMLQACLNVSNNSLAALEGIPRRELVIEVKIAEKSVQIVFADSGKGVAEPEALFHPFRSQSGNIGLGLYISRALMRRYGGDVRYERSEKGARFLLEIPRYGADRVRTSDDKQHQTIVS